MTHVAESVLVSVRVGHREHVEVDLVDVAVRGGVFHNLSQDIRADCRRNPFPRVDACNEKELFDITLKHIKISRRLPHSNQTVGAAGPALFVRRSFMSLRFYSRNMFSQFEI